jgi:uncharacterized protein YbcV (DUF1398 family)
MNDVQKKLAQACLMAAEENAKSFPEIVGDLIGGGFESYSIDFRQSVATYFLPSGEAVSFPTHRSDTAVSALFVADGLGAAIREAQALAPEYTYKSFCEKAKAAGCAGYMVSFTGRRALYFSRTAETHVELFPARN